MLMKSEDNVIPSEEAYRVMEKEIEIVCSLNLGLSYLKIKEYQMAIKYTSNVLAKDPDNDKALYRRGMAYIGTGDISKAKADLT